MRRALPLLACNLPCAKFGSVRSPDRNGDTREGPIRIRMRPDAGRDPCPGPDGAVLVRRWFRRRRRPGWHGRTGCWHRRPGIDRERNDSNGGGWPCNAFPTSGQARRDAVVRADAPKGQEASSPQDVGNEALRVGSGRRARQKAAASKKARAAIRSRWPPPPFLNTVRSIGWVRPKTLPPQRSKRSPSTASASMTPDPMGWA